MMVDAVEGESSNAETQDDEDLDPTYKGDEDFEDGAEEENERVVPKAGWSADTIQTEAMARLGICVNTTARIVVCLACASAVKPLELPGHLAKTHPPIVASQEFALDLAKTYDLRSELDSRPETIISAIYGLEVIGGYLACDNCGYACKTQKEMGRHMKKLEGCVSWRARPVQAFRPSSKRHHFGVSLEQERTEDLAEESLDPVTYLKKKFAPTPYSDIPIESPASARDANHFLGIEKWDKYVRDHTGQEITSVVRERAPELRETVRTCVDRFALDVATKLSKVDHEVRAAMADYTG